MKVLKPNGIFQALYVEFQLFQLIVRNSRQHKKPARALLFFQFFCIINTIFVCKVKFNNMIIDEEYRQQIKSWRSKRYFRD
jgi:hypothetical protein